MSDTKKPKYDAEAIEKHVESLVDIHEKIEKLNDERAEAIMRLTKDAEKKKQPLIKGMNAIIEKIPEFWATALSNQDEIVLSEEDADILKYLVRVEVDEDLNDDTVEDFKLIFTFKSNPYFEEKKLVKHVSDAGIDGCKVTWKAGKENTLKPSGSSSKPGEKRNEPESEPGFMELIVSKPEEESVEEDTQRDLLMFLKDNLIEKSVELFLGNSMSDMGSDEEGDEEEDL